MKDIIEIVEEYIYRIGKHPNFVEYDVDENTQRTFFVVFDHDHPHMHQENLAFWELEDPSFLDGAKHSRLDPYYYPLCPQTVTHLKKKYTFTGAVVYNNVIYAELGNVTPGNKLEKIVISRSYDEDYMNDLERHFNELEWQAVEKEQVEENYEEEGG